MRIPCRIRGFLRNSKRKKTFDPLYVTGLTVANVVAVRYLLKDRKWLEPYYNISQPVMPNATSNFDRGPLAQKSAVQIRTIFCGLASRGPIGGKKF